MRNKRFDQKLKDQYDEIGKQITIQIMSDFVKAKLIENNVKEENADFSDGFWDQKYLTPDGKEIMVEPEMKDSKWWGEGFCETRPFQYSDMDIPFRKVKNRAHLHVVISTCHNYAFLLTRKAMDEHLETSGGKPKIKKTIYEPNGASYFSTPVSKGIFVAKNKDGKWKRWKPTKASSG